LLLVNKCLIYFILKLKNYFSNFKGIYDFIKFFKYFSIKMSLYKLKFTLDFIKLKVNFECYLLKLLLIMMG